MVTYHRRGFSMRDKRRERDGKRIHISPPRTSKRLKTRPLWWLLVLTAIILFAIVYLSRIAQ